MKKSTKAALLSALVFPGVGHFFLKKYIHAALLITVSFVGIYYLVSTTVRRVLEILEKIQSGIIQPNVSEISELVATQSTGSDASLINTISLLLVVCWVYGIASSYRLAR